MQHDCAVSMVNMVSQTDLSTWPQTDYSSGLVFTNARKQRQSTS